MMKNMNFIFLLGSAFCVQTAISCPLREVIVIETESDYYNDYFQSEPMVNCTACRSIVKVVQKELSEGDKIVGPLLKMISAICHAVYGPVAKQCYDITSNTSAIIDYITHHNATYLCEQMHIC